MSASCGIKEGWEFAKKIQGPNIAAKIGNDYVSKVDETIHNLVNSINSNESSNLAVEQLKGFIAEEWHANTFNINAALKGSFNRATVEASNSHASVDVATNFGNSYSMKYYANSERSVMEQATNIKQAYYKYLNKSKAENPMTFKDYILKNGYTEDETELLMSIYQGQGRIIPSDQLEEAIKHLQEKIAKEMKKSGTNRVALLENYKETLRKLSDRIKDGEDIESIPLTKAEAEAIAALAKDGNFKPEDFGIDLKELVKTEHILQQSLKAGFTSAVISLVMQLGPEVYKTIDYLIKNGEIDIEQLKQSGLTALSATGNGFLRGSIASSLTIACHTGKLGTKLIDVSPSVIGAVTVIVIDTMKSSYMVARGDMSVKEMGMELTKEILIASSALSGGMVGQTIFLQLPVLGYMLGSLVGSVVASITINISEKTILSFCAETGFSFFGLVDQNYVVPESVIKDLGIDIVSIKLKQIKRIEVKKKTIRTLCIKQKQYNTIRISVLRRGVIAINKIGYIV